MKHPKKRVLIVDDHPAIREALSIRISRLNDLEVCGEAASFAEAVSVAAQVKPDVAVVDIVLPRGDGLELIKRLKESYPKLPILVCSMYGENLYAERALRAGATGYITKEHATDRIVDAIRQVLDGKIYVSEGMREKLLRRTVGQKKRTAERIPTDALTNRELQIFRLIGQGETTGAIAKQLHLSVHTIETHRERIKTKLGYKNSAELARGAVQWVLENR
jgi:DNA-binding NarL/FixJ family response regulator